MSILKLRLKLVSETEFKRVSEANISVGFPACLKTFSERCQNALKLGLKRVLKTRPTKCLL